MKTIFIQYKNFLRMLFFCIILVFLTGCGKENIAYMVDNFEAFNTVSRITYYAEEKDGQQEKLEELNALLNEWHQLFDIYNSYEGVNNLKTVNDSAGKQPVKVDERILDVLEFAIEAEKMTDGLCNVAFGSVLELWHDCRERALAGEKIQLPDDQALKKAAKHTKVSDIVIDRNAETVFLKDPFMSLDVGAFAKGYVADILAERAGELHMESVLINLGGNVETVGRKMDQGKGHLWTVGVQNPNDIDSYLYKMEIEDMSLVTSGDYQRFFEWNGKRYSHIIDPNTRYPAEQYKSVSIYTKNSALADVLSTALFIADVDKGKEILEKVEDCEVLWICADGSEQMTDGMKELLEI